MKEATEVNIVNLTNPFAGDNNVVNRTLDENTVKRENILKLLLKEIVAENEFYVLFICGTLIKKGRSRLKTSDYLLNEELVKFKGIKSYYGS